MCPAWTSPLVTAPPPLPRGQQPSAGSRACQCPAILAPRAQSAVPERLLSPHRDSRPHLADLTASKAPYQEVREQTYNLQTKVLTLAICVSVAGVRRSSQAAQSDGSSQSSSASLVRAAPPLAPFTGLTPPTKEARGVARSRSSAGANSQEIQRARRSLETNTTLAAVRDEDMQRDLENYFQRFGNIQRGRGKQ